jgi:hypothetical protein
MSTLMGRDRVYAPTREMYTPRLSQYHGRGLGKRRLDAEGKWVGQRYQPCLEPTCELNKGRSPHQGGGGI